MRSENQEDHYRQNKIIEQLLFACNKELSLFLWGLWDEGGSQAPPGQDSVHHIQGWSQHQSRNLRPAPDMHLSMLGNKIQNNLSLIISYITISPPPRY